MSLKENSFCKIAAAFVLSKGKKAGLFASGLSIDGKFANICDTD